ncbi:MAG: HAMP domain-containing protein [Deltaproteobacteria bacterium]|nr:HAMP domain-containing protein [Deltaproteobacteria bacterium]
MNQVNSAISGKTIQIKIALFAAAGGLGSALVMFLMFGLTARLTSSQINFFFAVTVVASPTLLAVLFPIYMKVCQPFVEYLERREQDRVDDALRKSALRAVLRCPRQAVLIGMLCYPVISVIVSATALSVFDDFDPLLAVMIVLGASFIGTTFQMSLYIPYTAVLEPVRNLLASEITDVQVRREAAPLFSLPRKVAISMFTLTFTAVVLMTIVIQLRAKYSLETYATTGYQGVLNALRETYEETPDQALLLKEAEQTYGIPLGIEFAVFDISTQSMSDETIFSQSELDRIEQEPSGGNGTEISTPHVYAWVDLPRSDSVLIAYTSRSSMNAVIHSARTTIVVFAALIILLTLFISFLFARDLGRIFTSLQDQVKRIAEGDLRRTDLVETDDELGELGRSIDEMTSALRGTVGKVMQTVTRVDTTAEEISAIAQDVSSVTADQLQESIQATEAIGRITLNVDGIAAAADELTQTVEESTSSALEIKAVAKGLNTHTVELSGKVTDSEAAIEQMVPRIQEVAGKTEQLTTAVRESMDSVGMLTQQISNIESSALETARLSTAVTEAAEKGRDRVEKTIEGMHSIANATEGVQQVIQALGTRIEDIGHIVDVIDDVADETNLLALNASIISAQAGEHGRAFAVVSDEIKDLADRVTSNTKEIASLIRDLQTESSNAIQVMEQGVSHVASGVSLSIEAGATLQEITRSADASGKQVEAIVASVHEHRGSARHAVDLMKRVGVDAEEIQHASSEYAAGTAVVQSASTGVGELTHQVKTTTQEQERSTSRIAENMEGVRSAVIGIQGSLQEQLSSCRETESSLEKLRERTGANGNATNRMTEAMKVLLEQSESLRAEVLKFKL